MKFLHTGDWHIGKKLNGYELLEEQQHAFNELMKVADEEQVDAIVIAGDLYDRSVPSVEAVELFNKMLIEMNLEKKYPVFSISGNHDSATRLETGGPWFEHLNFHLHTRLDQAFTPIEYQGVQFYLLPYFEPFHARRYFDREDIRSIEVAMKYVVAEMEKSFKEDMQQVLVAHFFVAGSEKSDSETKIAVGGLDVVPLTLLSAFDYVALGHLHYKNALQGKNARYSGSLLKYSLSEVKQAKGVWIVELAGEGVEYNFKEITPFRDVAVLEGSFAELMDENFYQNVNRENYLALSLTDKGVIPNVMNQLRKVYPRIIQLERVYGRDRAEIEGEPSKQLQKLTPDELVKNYFESTTGEKMTDRQESWLKEELTNIFYEK